jgi:thiol:disulfide interchange protein DsbD
VALDKPEVAGRFRELGLKALKADWTRRDGEIAKALGKYGRNSIPLYVLYTGKGDEFVLLPEILSPAIVLEALGRVENPATTFIPSPAADTL